MPDVNRERPETKPATDSSSEADGLESSIHSLSIRVEYYRSLEYCLKWKTSMYPRRSSRLSKPPAQSPQRSPRSNDKMIQSELGAKRQRTGRRKTEADKRSSRDIIDIINESNDARGPAEEGEGKFVEVDDKGVDESDDDCCSGTSSIMSGPSLLHPTTPMKLRPSRGLCSACQKLNQKAKKMKAPIKNKLLDNDPKSLTCDQWVLIKKWRPRKLSSVRRKLLIHEQLVEKKLRKGVMQSERYAGEGESSACSRPHVFLQRNLRRCVQAPVKKERKKKRGRKRRRDGSQGSRIAKQQRLHGNSSTHDNRLHLSRGHGSGPGFESCSEQEDTDLTVESTSSSVTLESTKPKEPPPRRKTPQKRSAFRDLLAQLRGNSSVIFKETR